MSKRTFQPNNRRRAKKHGFRARMRTRAGRAILAARRGKGRTELSRVDRHGLIDRSEPDETSCWPKPIGSSALTTTATLCAVAASRLRRTVSCT